ncbi:unnamed protein product [Larinioides sclopetarius]|uniref:Uncharacterized protein n=1 Tax=Larinioides sclopetarius TaxID=280406 RepID=A0AAV1ZPC8_9ARAC
MFASCPSTMNSQPEMPAKRQRVVKQKIVQQ